MSIAGKAQCVHELFEEQAARTPDRIALVFENQELTYRELDARSNQLARALVAHGMGPEKLAGICLRRSPELLIAMLAVLKSGAAYVPLDPSFPRRRIEAMLNGSGARTVVTDSSVAADLIPAGVDALALDREAAGISRERSEPLGATAGPENLAYVIYTSGSTGAPKGVMIEHRNVANFFAAMDGVAGRDAGVWLAVTSISFDISVLELLWTLCRGFEVVLASEDASRIDGPHSLAALLGERGVTHFQSTPSLLRMLASDPESLQALARLEKLLVGGEAVPAPLMARVVPGAGGEIYNMYGPTETTVWSTAHRIGAADCGSGGTIAIGKPVLNTFAYILDENLDPVPEGAAGELFLGGAGVVRGYLGRPDLTRERFLDDPFQPEADARMYRTGDLARIRPDGAMDYLGRLDQQVKIRGVRIELGEIEGALERYPGVRQAVVQAREDSSGDKRLVAFLVFEPGRNASPAELRRYLGDLLPAHMIPSTFAPLSSVPLTANGKVDRAALPAPDGIEMRGQPDYEAPQEDLEKQIANVWREALGVERVGLHDNYFDLGAHSLLVAEVHIQLKEALARDFPLLELFRYPTVHSLARHLSGAPADKKEAPLDRARERRESVRLRAQRARLGAS